MPKTKKKEKQCEEMTFWYLMLPKAHEDMFNVKSNEDKGTHPWCRDYKYSILTGPRIRYFENKDDMEKSIFQLAAAQRTDEFMCGTITIKRGKKVGLKKMIQYAED